MKSVGRWWRSTVANIRLGWDAVPRWAIALVMVSIGALGATVPVIYSDSTAKAIAAAAGFAITALVSFSSGRVAARLDNRRNMESKIHDALAQIFPVEASANKIVEALLAVENGKARDLGIRTFTIYINWLETRLATPPAFTGLLNTAEDHTIAQGLKHSWQHMQYLISVYTEEGLAGWLNNLVADMRANRDRNDEGRKREPSEFEILHKKVVEATEYFAARLSSMR